MFRFKNDVFNIHFLIGKSLLKKNKRDKSMFGLLRPFGFLNFFKYINNNFNEQFMKVTVIATKAISSIKTFVFFFLKVYEKIFKFGNRKKPQKSIVY